jgi:hypothetical protein
MFSTFIFIFPAVIAAAAATCLPFKDIPVDLSCAHDNVSRTTADPEDCSRFYECYNGCISNLPCPLDKFYDEKNAWCDLAVSH